MVTNTAAVLYFPEETGFSGMEVKAFWPMVTVLKSAKPLVQEAEPCKIRIPLPENPQLTGRALTTDCYILRWDGDELPSPLTAKELVGMGAKRLTSVHLFDYCSPDMRHWKVTCDGKEG